MPILLMHGEPSWSYLYRKMIPPLVAAGGDKILQKLIPGTTGQAHTTIANGGHFLQEDQSEQLADVMINFIKNN